MSCHVSPFPVPPPRPTHPYRVILAIRVRRAQPAILQTRLIISLQTAIIGILFSREGIPISNCLDYLRDVATILPHRPIAMEIKFYYAYIPREHKSKNI